jgi:hypothetical protein
MNKSKERNNRKKKEKFNWLFDKIELDIWDSALEEEV